MFYDIQLKQILMNISLEKIRIALCSTKNYILMGSAYTSFVVFFFFFFFFFFFVFVFFLFLLFFLCCFRSELGESTRPDIYLRVGGVGGVRFTISLD